MPKNWLAYAGAALTVGGLILGAGRFIGQIESRLNQLERQQNYLHGAVNLPRP
jgi:hypothetical protein